VKEIKIGSVGKQVKEIQILLAGFGGTVWDGIFGKETEKQVKLFQSDFIGIDFPTGIIDEETFRGLIRFAEKYPIDLEILKCNCGKCNGFGKKRFKNEYVLGKPYLEQFYKYEYPGIHKVILNIIRSSMFLAEKLNFPKLEFRDGGYRCSDYNLMHNRQTTNHRGKAVDLDFILTDNQKKENPNLDSELCESFRNYLQFYSNIQVGWYFSNKKSFEPYNIAPTWMHMDIRAYSKPYLMDEYFIGNKQELDNWMNLFD